MRDNNETSTGKTRGTAVLGSLRTEDGVGVVRMQDRYHTEIENLWSALTEPERLARWFGDVQGDLRVGGEYHLLIPGAMKATGRVEVCEPPHRLVVQTRDSDPGPGQPEATTTEAILTQDGDHTVLVVEERGLPEPLLPAYGAGIQIHFENLAAHLAGGNRGDDEQRWSELVPTYERLATNIGPRAFGEADRPALLATLEYQRASVRAIVQGLSEQHWHTSVVPSGWTPAGLIAHLGGAERHWTCDVILNNDPGHRFDDDTDEPYDPYAPFVIDWPSEKVLTYYRDQIQQTDQMLAVTALDAAPRGWHGAADSDQLGTVREIVLHLIEETAAHSGHLEIARELLDGTTRIGLR